MPKTNHNAVWAPNHVELALETFPETKPYPEFAASTAVRLVWLLPGLHAEFCLRPNSFGMRWARIWRKTLYRPLGANRSLFYRGSRAIEHTPILDRSCADAAVAAGANLVALPPQTSEGAQRAIARQREAESRLKGRGDEHVDIGASLLIEGPEDLAEIPVLLGSGIGNLVFHVSRAPILGRALATLRWAIQERGLDSSRVHLIVPPVQFKDSGASPSWPFIGGLIGVNHVVHGMPPPVRSTGLEPSVLPPFVLNYQPPLGGFSRTAAPSDVADDRMSRAQHFANLWESHERDFAATMRARDPYDAAEQKSMLRPQIQQVLSSPWEGKV